MPPAEDSFISRRKVLRDSAALTLGALAASNLPVAAAEPAPAFKSRWQDDPDRIWLGAEYWANPMQDWRVAGGRIECIVEKPGRNVHVLTRELADAEGDLRMSVQIGRVDGKALGDGKGSAGFKIGILGTLGSYPELRDYRNNLAFSSGLDVGFTAQGALFAGDVRNSQPGAIDLSKIQAAILDLAVAPSGGGYTLTATLKDATTGATLGEIKRDGIRAGQLIGNVAVAANFGAEGGGGAKGKGKKGKQDGGIAPGNGSFWFADWQISGSKVTQNENHRFGPILFNHYTLSEGVLKMTAQMPPLGSQDSDVVRLQVEDGAQWRTIAEEKIHPLARTATFRIPTWDTSKDVSYRLAYSLKSAAGGGEYFWPGTIRRDPVDKDELSVADVSCNIHTAFPNAPYVANVAKLDPDVLAFVGDQFYESTAGYGVQREPLEPAILDYLRKWYYHGWTWRELTRDRPSVSLPDDHDVYQGNLWGMGGAPQVTTQEAGGYNLPGEWVNVVHRTQTAHHPDAYDAIPGKQSISNYYGPLTYGRVSFAIIADRQYKSAPEGNVPPTGDRGDHVIDPDFDPQTANVPGLQLLGEKQLEFIKAWARDWTGADMKAVISQTIFAGMATTHGAEREVLRCDYDQNAWPQAARNAALREIRKAFAFHIAGDQHLPGVIHYGIDAHRDAGAAFAGPAVNVGYPRWWEPTEKINGRKPGQDILGDFTDHFGHPMTVLAVKNGAVEPRKTTVEHLIDKASGFGLVIFNKAKRSITVHCWPFASAFGRAEAKQFDNWPVQISQLDQYARQAAAHLPTLKFAKFTNPVVEIIDASDELIYALRVQGGEFQPHVFAEGSYKVRIMPPDSTTAIELKDLAAKPGNDGVIEVGA